MLFSDLAIRQTAEPVSGPDIDCYIRAHQDNLQMPYKSARKGFPDDSEAAKAPGR